ncbi:MAG: hypothetical protein MJY78_00230 [Fibrobacter sp.]|nr:hypothetical protein [Fibrobacter sp.]
MLLKPNLSWEKNQGITLPVVQATATIEGNYLRFDFTVEEPLDCFRSEVKCDNGNSWEDSCVEVFLENPTNPREYYNFEITSRGFILAAVGECRECRAKLEGAALASIIRKKELASIAGDLICWGIAVLIPPSIFGLENFDGITLKGNLYKCGDKTKTPHYLSAFPIDTEKPDFHRPEFFQKIL